MSPTAEVRTLPYAETKMARYLSRQIDALKGEVSQRDIATKLGYPRSNIISMFKSGEAKVPLDKIPALAEAIHVDVAHLIRLGLEQYWPDKLNVLSQIFGVTKNEQEIVEYIRKTSHDADPKLNTELRSAIKHVLTAR